MRTEQNCGILLNNFVMTFVNPGNCLNVQFLNKKENKSGENVVNNGSF